jgi:hypothetical protein
MTIEIVEVFYDNGTWQKITFINGLKATEEITIPKKPKDKELEI